MTNSYPVKFNLTRESYIIASRVLSRLQTSSVSGNDFVVYRFNSNAEETVLGTPSSRTMELSDKLDRSISKIIEGIVEGLHDSRK